MPAWMGYATVLGVAVGAAGLLVEGGVRRLGLPVRWVWATVMAATVAVPLALAVASAAGSYGLAAGGVAGELDTLVLAAWAVLSVILVASLRVSAWKLRSNRRSWRTRRVDGHTVAVSAGFGPGVIGARHSRIVLPTWVLDASPRLRRLVVAHELEHVRARDAALLTVGLWAALLVPWCLPLWWQLHRLRQAVETDCDARMLDGWATPREYADALVTIAGQRTHNRLPVPALSLQPAELERRLRLITGGTGRSHGKVVGLLGLAAALTLAMSLVPRPASPPSPHLPTLRWQRPTVPATVPREAHVILSVEPGPETGR